MTEETKYPVKIVRGVEVAVLPLGTAWASCNRCPFVGIRGSRCVLSGTLDFCGPDNYYASPDKVAIARLKGEL